MIRMPSTRHLVWDIDKIHIKGRRGHYRMVVGFTSTFVISAYYH